MSGKKKRKRRKLHRKWKREDERRRAAAPPTRHVFISSHARPDDEEPCPQCGHQHLADGKSWDTAYRSLKDALDAIGTPALNTEFHIAHDHVEKMA